MPNPDRNRTTDFTPPADAQGETRLPPPEAQATRAHDPIADAHTRTGPPESSETTSGPLPNVPGYAVEGEIARGGMGVVYRARHLRLNRPAAIKMILGGKYHDPTTRLRFLIEAEAVAALDHPHVIHVYEFGTHENLPFFALEFVGGGTLADKLRARSGGGPYAPRAAAELLAKVADGIAAAHAKGIVHRDLKPSNVLMTEAGEPKVADFGLAKVGRSDVTATGAVVGTPSYMSPEQAAGRSKEVGTPTDVYALGAVLYEVLTGRPPFKGESSMETLQQVLTREPVRPRVNNPAIPRDLETVCLKCLAKDPAKRYATAAEFAADLRAFLEGRPIAARPVGRLERAAKWVKRNAVVTGLAAAVVLALVAGTAVSFLKYREAAEAKGFAEDKERVAKEEADRAKREATKAERARDFLVSIFQKVETDEKGGNVTIRQLLAGADADIARAFADEPELRAELFAALGKVKRAIARRIPHAMILSASGPIQVRSAAGAPKAATLHALVNLDDKVTVPAGAEVQLVFLSDLHKEWVRPGREVTIAAGGCEPADAVRERDTGVMMTFKHLPKGSFYMGWSSVDVQGNSLAFWNRPNKPGVKTEIAADFEIAVHDVTQGQWQAVMGTNPSWFSRTGGGRGYVLDVSDEELKLFPVENVSQDDAMEFVQKLNERERGRGWVYRLPKEAEWEYACRCGATTKEDCEHLFYLDKPGEVLTSTAANFDGNYPTINAPSGPYLERTSRVGAYPPNKLGLCDMHGNVYQWCDDKFDARQSANPVYRGGTWRNFAISCHASIRWGHTRTHRDNTLGFRVVRVPAPAGK